jgi:hypothetical protein
MAMEGPLAPSILCYPGKEVEIYSNAGFETTATVLRANGSSIEVIEALPNTADEIFVVFLAEHYRATAATIANDKAHNIQIDDGFYPINLRAGARAIVDLSGTWYLRPPALGVPMQIVNLSVSGLAVLPVDGQIPKLRERRMIAFQLGGRMIKAVVELVEIEERLWRLQFIKLGLSDEEEIAGFVIRSQLNERHRLATAETQVYSTLDPHARIRFPLIEEADVANGSISLTAGNITVNLPCISTILSNHALIEKLVGQCRIGDLRDIRHYINNIGFPEYERDLILVGCSILKASHDGVSLSEILVSAVNPKQKTAITSVSNNILERTLTPPPLPQELPTTIDHDGHRWIMQIRSSFTALFTLQEEQKRNSTGTSLPSKTDPIAFAQHVAGGDKPILLGYSGNDRPTADLARAYLELAPSGSRLVHFGI